MRSLKVPCFLPAPRIRTDAVVANLCNSLVLRRETQSRNRGEIQFRNGVFFQFQVLNKYVEVRGSVFALLRTSGMLRVSAVDSSLVVSLLLAFQRQSGALF